MSLSLSLTTNHLIRIHKHTQAGTTILASDFSLQCIWKFVSYLAAFYCKMTFSAFVCPDRRSSYRMYWVFHSHNHTAHTVYDVSYCKPLPSSTSFSAIRLRIVHFYTRDHRTARNICCKWGWNANRRRFACTTHNASHEVLGVAFVCACCRRRRWFYGGSELS